MNCDHKQQEFVDVFYKANQKNRKDQGVDNTVPPCKPKKPSNGQEQINKEHRANGDTGLIF